MATSDNVSAVKINCTLDFDEGICFHIDSLVYLIDLNLKNQCPTKIVQMVIRNSKHRRTLGITYLLLNTSIRNKIK